MLASKDKKEYGLIGFPLVHSFSKDYFNKKFISENIYADYINFELPDIGHLMEVISEHPFLNGLNVTIPYKEQVIPYLDELDPDAKAVGAVNVIKFIQENGILKLKGYNSDIVGFSNSIEPLLKPFHKRALILGTGGAAKAVAYSLTKLGIEYKNVSRQKRADNFVYEELSKDIINKYTVIVNTTPLGMFPNIEQCPDIPYRFLSSKHLCYDLLYNPDETLFMKKSASYGATVKNGLEMLLLQAFESWNIWQK